LFKGHDYLRGGRSIVSFWSSTASGLVGEVEDLTPSVFEKD